MPQLWLLSPGEARTLIAQSALAPRIGWPQAFRFSAPAFRFCVVVLSELPPGRNTLLLRLLGRGRTVSSALAELKALAPDDPMRQPITEVIVRQRFAELHSDFSEVEQAMLEEEFQKFKQQIRDQGLRDGRDQGLRDGRDQGRDEGRRRVVTRLLEMRFGPLDAEATAHVTHANGELLDLFAERILSATSLGEVFRTTP